MDFLGFLGNPNSIRIPPTANRYVIGQLEPFTMYKIVMSVETQFGEGQSSDPVMNRTAEGSTWPAFSFSIFLPSSLSLSISISLRVIQKIVFVERHVNLLRNKKENNNKNKLSYTEPSVPLDLNLIEVTNRSMSITWRAPVSPNGASTYYQVFRSNDTNVWATSYTTRVRKTNSHSLPHATSRISWCSYIKNRFWRQFYFYESILQVSLEVEAYTGYVISVQACNDPKLCSELSEPIPVTTKIGGMYFIFPLIKSIVLFHCKNWIRHCVKHEQLF